MAECALGGEPIQDTALVCHPCAAKHEQRWRDAAALWPELDTTITRQGRTGDPTPRAGRPAPPEPIRPTSDPADDHQTGYAAGLPYAEAASDVAWVVRNTVTTWARVICETVRADPPTDTDDLLRWVAGRVDWMRYEPYAAEAFEELDYAARLIARATDRPLQRVYLGPCGEPDGLAGACPGELYAHRHAIRAVCRTCGAAHDAITRRHWLDGLVREHAYTAAEIGGAYEPQITAERIRQWASRRLLLAAGSDRYGRPLYSLSDVLDLAGRMRRRHRAAA